METEKYSIYDFHNQSNEDSYENESDYEIIEEEFTEWDDGTWGMPYEESYEDYEKYENIYIRNIPKPINLEKSTILKPDWITLGKQVLNNEIQENDNNNDNDKEIVNILKINIWDELKQKEKERLEKERLEKERLEKERLEKERLEKERFEKERLEKEKLKNKPRLIKVQPEKPNKNNSQRLLKSLK
jgi:hypothetical protein